jgi:hypothetical protein
MAQHTAPRTRQGSASNGLGVVLVILGILFLLDQVLGMSIWTVAWPYGIVVIGLAFFAAMLIGGKSLSGLAIPGSVVTTVGLILAYQDAFDRYETWSYAWSLIVIAVGFGLLVKGFWTDDAKSFQAGLRIAGIGAVLFVAFAAFFELVIGFSGINLGFASRWFWPVVMIALGGLLLLRSNARRAAR